VICLDGAADHSWRGRVEKASMAHAQRSRPVRADRARNGGPRGPPGSWPTRPRAVSCTLGLRRPQKKLATPPTRGRLACLPACVGICVAGDQSTAWPTRMRDPARTGWRVRRVRPGPAMAIVALAMLSFADRAAAGCGDYLVIGNPSPQTRAAMLALDHGHERPPIAPPCDGPRCRGGKSAPQPPPAAPAPAPTAGQQAVCPRSAPIHPVDHVTSAAPPAARCFRSVPLSPAEKPPPNHA
jgi:hypothetical protein